MNVSDSSETNEMPQGKIYLNVLRDLSELKYNLMTNDFIIHYLKLLC